ncbi:MAG: hypothetical protein N2C14_04910 [Planctomycetales bacterium]
MTTATAAPESEVQELFEFLRGQPIIFHLAARLPSEEEFLPLDYDRDELTNGLWLLRAGRDQAATGEFPPHAPPALDTKRDCLNREQLHEEIVVRFDKLPGLVGLAEAALVWHAEGDLHPRAVWLRDEPDQGWSAPVRQALFENLMNVILQLTTWAGCLPRGNLAGRFADARPVQAGARTAGGTNNR